jgi:hypothetical protein
MSRIVKVELTDEVYEQLECFTGNFPGHMVNTLSVADYCGILIEECMAELRHEEDSTHVS